MWEPRVEQSIFLPKSMMEEITAKATKPNRSVSWLIQQALSHYKKTEEVYSCPKGHSTNKKFSEEIKEGIKLRLKKEEQKKIKEAALKDSSDPITQSQAESIDATDGLY